MSSGRGFRHNDGDWTCPECNNLNFARRMQCNRCGVERKYEPKRTKKGGIEIGKLAAEKSKGLFSADDWMCKTCGNVNWARRNDCNMCNTPKVNVQEERTGYGGGFNERDGVEYKEKEDSDGEFDEFGRKKKKYRGKVAESSKYATKSARDVHDDDDEEESGDDEDASKYDLGADDDEDEDGDEGDASKYDLAASDDEDGSSHGSRDRSRSRSSSRSRNNGRSSSRSTSRSRSGSRRHRSRSYSSSSDSSDNHRKIRKRKRRSRSRSRSRSPHYRRKRSSSRERKNSRR